MPIQQPLVTIPPAAVADRWIIEWKWRYPTPAHQAMWAGRPANRPPEWKDDKPETPWRPWENIISGKSYEITNRKSAHHRVRRLREVYPWQRFRLRESHWVTAPGWVSGPEDFQQ